MKNLIFTLSLLINLTISAQKSWAVITLNDGTIKKGYARIKSMASTVKYKANKNANKEFIEFDDIKSLSISENGEFVDYEIKYKKIPNTYTNNDDDDDDDDEPIKNKKEFHYSSPLLLKVEIKGKVNLYSILVANPPSMGPNGMMYGGGGTHTVYYVSKNNSEFISSLVGTFGGGFKRRAMKFFNDCPELVEKIKRRKYKFRDFKEIVQFYNNKCNK